MKGVGLSTQPLLRQCINALFPPTQRGVSNVQHRLVATRES